MIKQYMLSIILLMLFVGLASHTASAAYSILNMNTTITLNSNTTAHVREVIDVYVSNDFYKQYENERLALNLSLSQWQSIIGSSLVEHIVNTKYGVYNFKFLPGPLSRYRNGYVAKLFMSYNVKNVTSYKNTAPRTFLYIFNNKVFNFKHAASGEVLSNYTTLTIILPKNAQIKDVYPASDLPAEAFSNGYTKIRSISWNKGEPLASFKLTFEITESLQNEVGKFFLAAYRYFGIFTYIILGAIILLFIFYTYLKASR